jgi:hypothetical protein
MSAAWKIAKFQISNAYIFNSPDRQKEERQISE